MKQFGNSLYIVLVSVKQNVSKRKEKMIGKSTVSRLALKVQAW